MFKLFCGIIALAITTGAWAEEPKASPTPNPSKNAKAQAVVTSDKKYKPSQSQAVSVEQNPPSIVWPGPIILRAGASGKVTFDAPGPGTFIFRYATGPDKGKVIKTVTVKKAGPVTAKIVDPPWRPDGQIR